jgi:hypothetical protein
MSHLLDRLNFLQSKELEQFSNGHGEVTRENRDWEDTYRNRWRHDKVVRSTHGELHRVLQLKITSNPINRNARFPRTRQRKTTF